MNWFLIRHGESFQNTKENNINMLPDNKVELTKNGILQAKETGNFLLNYINENNIDITNSCLYISPYNRTRKTAEEINKIININNVKEDYLLIEQMYGLFSDKDINMIKKIYPEEFSYYNNYYQNSSKFYAKFPQGESPFDVAIRTRMFLNEINQNNYENIFIVSHGTTIRTILMNICGYSPEWYNNEPVMDNCAIRYIKDKDDLGYIYKGEKVKVLKK